MGAKAESDRMENERDKSIEELRGRIADLKARWPKHSVPPAMLIELEDLEETLNRLLSDAGREDET